MDPNTATEIAYNNGYNAAAREIFEVLERLFFDGTTPLGLTLYCISCTKYIKLKEKYTQNATL